MHSRRPGLVLFSGNGNKSLSEAISKKLSLKLGDSKVERFSDGEISVKIEENVRGMDVFLIQPTSPPAHENLMELVIMVDALKNELGSWQPEARAQVYEELSSKGLDLTKIALNILDDDAGRNPGGSVGE